MSISIDIDISIDIYSTRQTSIHLLLVSEVWNCVSGMLFLFAKQVTEDNTEMLSGLSNFTV